MPATPSRKYRIAPSPPDETGSLYARSPSTPTLPTAKTSPSYKSPSTGNLKTKQRQTWAVPPVADEPTADSDDDLDYVFAENKAYADKLKMESALARAQTDLSKANARIEQLTMQIATLHGRSSALRLASEEDSVAGKTWNIRDVRRFTASAQGPADFCNDSLREMLDTASQATDRRVRFALAEAAKARTASDRIEAEGERNLESAFAKCKEPAAEHACRAAAQALFIASKSKAKMMKIALKRLEEEAFEAQSAHAADLRSCCARLVAQRDAISDSVLAELQAAEVEGDHSIHGKQRELTRTQGLLAESEATVASLRAELSSTLAKLKEEKAARRNEGAAALKEDRQLRKELSQAEAQLAAALSESATHSTLLGNELRGVEDLITGGVGSVEAAEAEREVTVGKLEATLSSFKTEARMMHSDLIGRLRAQDMERQALVRRHEAELTAKDLEAIKERTYFRGKIEALNSQLRKVRCERSAHDRAMTYWLKEGQYTMDHGGRSPSPPARPGPEVGYHAFPLAGREDLLTDGWLVPAEHDEYLEDTRGWASQLRQ